MEKRILLIGGAAKHLVRWFHYITPILNENIVPFEIDEYYNVDIDNYSDLEILKERMENK